MERIENLLELSRACPVKMTAEIIEGKWSTLIIRELLYGKKRYSELQRALHGISPKILSSRLKFLEERGLLTRKAFATIPPTTEYALTPLGEKMKDVLLAMAIFGKELYDEAIYNDAAYAKNYDRENHLRRV